ncbi:hypothetical protein J4219_08240 [Candidatus Woesearchaeota archaeon]|nr:hypothetical protein [Candidatus Woesearchaeota archaeon]
MAKKQVVKNVQLNQIVISLLRLIKRLIKEESNAFLRVARGRAIVRGVDRDLAVIDADSIKILSGFDITEKIAASGNNCTIDNKKVARFLTSLSGRIIRLNHIGLSYSCASIRQEIMQYKKALETSNFKLYEEPSGSKNKWLFIGDTKNWNAPLFEIVLTQRKNAEITKWTPHFQIDIDSTLSVEELNTALEKTFGAGFDWKLTIKNYGTVLGMKILGSTNGTKLCLGIGTNLRNTEYHRKRVLKELK